MSSVPPAGALRSPPASPYADALARYEPLAVGIADRFTPSLYRDDLRQVARVAVWQAAQAYLADRGPLAPLVRTTVRRALIDEQRKLVRRARDESAWPQTVAGGARPLPAPDAGGTVGPLATHLSRLDSARAAPDPADQTLDVQRALGRLPAELRAVAVRTLLLDEPLAVVGADLGLSTAAVMRRRNAALARLAPLLLDYA